MAEGQELACAHGQVEIVGALQPSWREETSRICEKLREMPDIDSTARVRVVAGDPISVEVLLPDDRIATRRVASIEALSHTVEALVTVLPERVTTKAAPAPPPASAPPPHVQPDIAPRPSKKEPSVVAVGLGGVATARVQGSPLYLAVGGEIWASINVSRWVFALAARWDALQAQPTGDLPGFEMTTFGAGLDFCRRFELTRLVGIDAAVGVQVLEELQSFESQEGEKAGSATDIRLLTAVRLHIGGRGVRFTTGLELELSPIRVGRDVRIDPDLPTLPAFGIGLGAGISWEQP